MLAEMAREGGPQGRRTRLEAARLAGATPEHFEGPLADLVRDPDPEVSREAIRIAGGAATDALVPALLERLGHPQLSDEAAEALARYGNRVLDALERHLSDASAPIDSRRRIPAVLSRIGSAEAAEVALGHLLEADIPLRFAVISCLNKLRQLHPEL